MTATYAAIAAPTNRDWIGLYTPAGVDTAFIDWLYVNSCNKTGNNSLFAAGSCLFLIPNSLANGQYQLRLFTNNSYTRLATSANFNVAPVPPSPFVDNGDGTVTDTTTSLQWAKNTGTVGSLVGCGALPACADPYDVNNIYTWSSSGAAANGPLYTNYLDRVNGKACETADCQGLGGHTDWRIPTIAELRTILLAQLTCGTSPCIHPTFGPTAASFYWSSTTNAGSPSNVWVVNFGDGSLFAGGKTSVAFARAVRGGR